MQKSAGSRFFLKFLCVLLSLVLAAGCVLLVKRLFTKQETAQTRPGVTGALEIYMLDVGQGEAVLAVFPEGNTLLVDCGPKDAATALVSTLRSLGISRLDTLLLTHSHADHTGALSALLKSIPADTVLLAGNEAYYTTVLSVLNKRRVSYRFVTSQTQLSFSPSVTATLLHPAEDTGGEDENETCAVLKLTNGDTSVLMMSDAAYATESRLLSLYSRRQLQSDVLLVGHHGSSTSSSLHFLKAVSPSLALISAGANNEYGHPHASVLKNLRSVNAEIHCTADEGTLHVRLDGSKAAIIK